MTKKFTHTATLEGYDNGEPHTFRRTVMLRELKGSWVDQSGTRYGKYYGLPLGGKGTMHRLILDTIREIPACRLLTNPSTYESKGVTL